MVIQVFENNIRTSKIQNKFWLSYPFLQYYGIILLIIFFALFVVVVLCFIT